MNLNCIFNGFIFNTSTQLEKGELIFLDLLNFEYELSNNGWELYSFISDKAFMGEDNISNSFLYPVICCRAHNRAILLSYNRKIITYLTEKINNLQKIRFTNTYISVDQLVRELYENQKKYIVTLLYANYVGHGEALSSVMLSGSNICEAEMFIKYVSSLNIFRCGLKIWNTNDELLRLSNSGAISLKFNENIPNEINMFFNYIKELNLLR